MNRWSLGACGLLIIPLCAMAETSQEVKTLTIDSEINETERRRYEAWGLDVEEWQRYKALMATQRGLWTPDLDPLMVLGIHARSEEERRRYAELAVTQEVARVEGELAFERAYQEAGKRLYPDADIIDISVLQSRSELASPAGELVPGDRILWFTRLQGCPQCDERLPEVLEATVDHGFSLDIFFLDTGPGDDAAIRTWAAQHDISLPKVMARRITLNHDNDTAKKLGVGNRPLTLIHRDHGGKHHEIRLSDLR